MFTIQTENSTLRPALLVIDVQNGYVSKGGSYDKLGMDTSNYRAVVPKIRELIDLCREVGIPIFYTESVREPSGIDLLTRVHRILPKSREERIRKVPICVRGTWDAQTINELKPTDADHVIIKRRDSAFQDTEINAWLRALGINTIIFAGVDTSICVETSLRDAFNQGYDVILISDATASGNKEHYNTTLQRIRDYYGVVMDFERLANLSRWVQQNNGHVPKDRIDTFIQTFNLLDPRESIA
ncbi:MAG: cysteine hydrolase [Thermoproteota archaeon]|nr:cysteine hydrolase [Thermoproteota archaeon]